MIKLGNAYFAEDAIEAIVPEFLTDRRSGKDVAHAAYDVYLACGDIVSIKASDTEIHAAIALLGIQAPAEEPEIPLDRDELEELAGLFGAGFRWAACDRDGKAFAYKDKPKKGNVSWQGYEIKRLHNEFAAITFDADEPLDLTKLFTGVPG